MIINNIDNAVGSQDEKDIIKGEALIYRAWCHFNLVQLYAKRYVAGSTNDQMGVPIMLTNNFDGQPRNTVGEVYTQVNLDLDEAIALLGTYVRPNKSHMIINVARGLKARAALVMQNWSEAASLAARARETVPAYYVASTNTGTALIDEIILNRRLELWGEGFRFTDLKRLNLTLNRNGANHQVALCTVTDVPAGDVRWEWLIPRQEMDANKQMVQNPL